MRHLDAYEVLQEKNIEDLNSNGILLRHKKSGAKVVVLENDDDNKVFYIGFRTPPKDSTGVAHILEHSVLCGSKNFPAKDPFVELVKGSLNTFLNAMTYPDKTVYPVASCNASDFQNLMHVYLDAVFFPRIYDVKNIFLQEGWHYELENEADELTVNGVVYNEMKGAFSSPDDVLEREIFNSLYPDTAYGVESGGAPEAIPDLTYEDFLAFHKNYYHPSNSYIYLYGDGDMAERLAWMDENYLSLFDSITVDSMPGEQKAFDRPMDLVKEYPISEEEEEADNTYLSYNAVIGTSLDKELYLAFQVLDYALVDAQGAPVKQALIDAGIGTEVYSTYENGIFQPYYSIVAKNANKEQKAEFVSVIEKQIEKMIREGIDKNALLAGLNSLEFRYRESDFGSTPRGLILGLQMFDSWLYDASQPFMHIEANDSFAVLKERIHSDYYENLLQKYFLDNNHKTIVTVLPKKGLTTKKDKAFAEKLDAYRNSLTEEEIKEIIRTTKELWEYQETPDSEEVLKCIPRLRREDIGKTVQPLINEERKIKDVPALFHNVFTNEIAYVKLLFFMDDLSPEYYPYVSLLKNFFNAFGTEHYTYEQLGYEVNKYTGGISPSTIYFQQEGKTDDFRSAFMLKGKVLYSEITKALDLMKEILFTSDFTDEKRMKEVISELKSRVQAKLLSAGHSTALGRAQSYYSEYGAMLDLCSGIGYYEFLADAEKNFAEKKDEIIHKMQELVSYLFRKENLFIDITATEEGYGLVEKEMEGLFGKLYDTPVEMKKSRVVPVKKNEGLTTSGQVQYVCRAGNFMKKGLPYTGTLRILKTIMGYEYLWTQVRVKGGAYGCMSGYSRCGDAFFVSYRDPNLSKTVQVFENAADFVKNFAAQEEEMTKYIIGTISDMDVPLTPSGKGARSLSAYLSGITEAILQKERDEVLGADAKDIRELVKYVEAFMSDECFCTVGNEDKIKGEKELFASVIPLFPGN
ncbi:MAG: insulinase family protein [Lachnospiraceae bacterium]|nr:insulinase family protein [Lachnospiraceae bacterium]